MEISKAIISGSAAALEAALSFLSLPRLTCLVPPWTIALETENARQHGEARVAENVLISSLPEYASKAYVSDNVAPGPWSWHLDGFIPGNVLAEPTNLYTPIVRMNVNNIRNAFKRGSILQFKDGDNHIYENVVIQSLDIDTKADCRNKVPFAMVLKEINILDSIGGDIVAAASTIEAGTAGGEATKVGSTAAREAETYSMLAPAGYGVAAAASTPQD